MPKAFVDALIENDSAKLKAICTATPPDSPWHKTFRAMITAMESFRDMRLAGEAWLQIREVLSCPPQDAELLAVLLRQATQLSLHANRIGDATRCCRILKQLDGRLLRPEVKAQVLYAESTLNYALGHFAQAQVLLTQALALEIPAGSNTWYRLKAARADRALLNCDFATVEQDLADIEPYAAQRPPLLRPFETLKASLACTRGKLEEALALLGPLPQDPLKINAHHLVLNIELLLRTARVKEAEEILRRTLD